MVVGLNKDVFAAFRFVDRNKESRIIFTVNLLVIALLGAQGMAHNGAGAVIIVQNCVIQGLIVIGPFDRPMSARDHIIQIGTGGYISNINDVNFRPVQINTISQAAMICAMRDAC